MRFNKAKGRVLHRGRGNPWYRCRDGEQPCQEGLGVLGDEKLAMTWQ